MRTETRRKDPATVGKLVMYCLLLLAVIGLMSYLRSFGTGDKLVVYCAHDAVFAEPILRAFEREAGIKVLIRYDTEATKSLGLTELILAERNQPRCDVFWNNEPLGTMDLAQQGALKPYKGPGYDRIPAAFKDQGAYWTGFGARFRVWIVNTNAMAADEKGIADRMKGDLARVSIAKPLYGTTRVHYTALWSAMGADALKAWHADCRKRGIKEVSGNANSRRMVADGLCDFGLTDTDDFFEAYDNGKPVAQVPATVDAGKTICVPNTVAIVNGTRRADRAQQLVDYLLSARVETMLACSPSRQVPLGPVDDTKIPDEVRAMQPWVSRGYPVADLGAARPECLRWLKSEYAAQSSGASP